MELVKLPVEGLLLAFPDLPSLQDCSANQERLGRRRSPAKAETTRTKPDWFVDKKRAAMPWEV